MDVPTACYTAMRLTKYFTLLFFCLSAPTMASSSYPQHSGDSPFSFSIVAEPSAEFPLSDRQPGTLDSYKFSDSEQYQIQVELPVSRYVEMLQKRYQMALFHPRQGW